MVTFSIVFALIMMSSDFALCKTSTPPPRQSFKVLTYNIAHGRGSSLNQALLETSTIDKNLNYIAKVIKSINPDIVGLQEADGPSRWSGNFDHVKRLAEISDFQYFYRGEHSQFNMAGIKIDYGTALLSKIPMTNTISVPFALKKRDTKGIVMAQVELLPGKTIHFASLHLDFLSKKTRQQQIDIAINFFKKIEAPLIVVGDFNCDWISEKSCLQRLASSLNLNSHNPERNLSTYPSKKPRKRIDWIMVSKGIEIVNYNTINTEGSDHLPVVAEIKFVKSFK